ncbi:MAG: hypothetical protein J7605_06635 [Variovorax sp.]|nr:hypothetical protein [Variovorax sp.]
MFRTSEPPLGRTVCGAALNRHLRENIAPCKRPERIDELPVNAYGKVFKLRLRALL